MSNTEPEVARSGRRALLKLAGAATVGAVAATAVGQQPASANDGDPWRIGQTNIGLAETSLFGSNLYIGVSPTDKPSVQIVNSATSGVKTGLLASARDFGVVGTSTYIGVKGVSATSSDVYCGGTGRLRLEPHLPQGPPTTSGYIRGEIIVDERGVFWACVGNNGGGEGVWERLTNKGYFPITPARVYDSRRPMPPMASGVLSHGQSRTIDVRNGRDIDTGAINAEKVVSSAATAVTFNLTVAGTTSNFGYLSVNPGLDTVEHSSHINWSSAGQVLANAGTVGVDSDLRITVKCGGAAEASTHFLVDVTGYYI